MTRPTDPSTELVLGGWISAVAASTDACVLLDESGVVASASPAFALLVCRTLEEVVGRHLVDEVLELLDFGRDAGPADSYAHRIPPMLSLSASVLTRGLLRVRRGDGGRVTLDAVAAPLHDQAGTVLGSLTFFAPV